VGAWIETRNLYPILPLYVGSHPAWVRGLKQEKAERDILNAKSHPAWVRGLKHVKSIGKYPSVDRTPRGCVD